ncbi:MAG: DUF177 domain-containing protein [Candidatus Omnitrophota bacterium]
MKVQIDQIRPEGLTIEGSVDPQSLDLNTEIVSFNSPLKIEAGLRRVGDVVNVSLTVGGSQSMVCCRCLAEFTVGVAKNFSVDYPLEKGTRFIDLDPDIRDCIMLDYPLKPLCKGNCKGLCPRCGANLNDVTKCDCD